MTPPRPRASVVYVVTYVHVCEQFAQESLGEMCKNQESNSLNQSMLLDSPSRWHTCINRYFVFTEKALQANVIFPNKVNKELDWIGLSKV